MKICIDDIASVRINHLVETIQMVVLLLQNDRQNVVYLHINGKSPAIVDCCDYFSHPRVLFHTVNEYC